MELSHLRTYSMAFSENLITGGVIFWFSDQMRTNNFFEKKSLFVLWCYTDNLKEKYWKRDSEILTPLPLQGNKFGITNWAKHSSNLTKMYIKCPWKCPSVNPLNTIYILNSNIYRTPRIFYTLSMKWNKF